MIPIRTFSQLSQGFVDAIPNLSGFVLVAQDSHAVNKLKDKRGIHLVAVIPTTQTDGAPGRTYDANTSIFFILTKATAGITNEKELDYYEETQNIALAIRDSILESQEDGCPPWDRLKPSSLLIEPEYNLFGGWSGWSLTLTF